MLVSSGVDRQRSTVYTDARISGYHICGTWMRISVTLETAERIHGLLAKRRSAAAVPPRNIVYNRFADAGGAVDTPGTMAPAAG